MTAESRAREAAPKMGFLAATLAHEIRNPLASISTNGETLRAMLEEGDNRTRYVDSILDEVERLEVLVSSVLRFAGREKLRHGILSLRGLAAEIFERARVRASRQGVALAITGDEGTTVGDRDLLERLLDNLVRNALDAMPDGGRLTADVRRDSSGRIALEIADSGDGLPDPEIVFEPFFTTRVRGHGLGLPLARKIAERHGGRLTATSVADGGSVFRLDLPGGDQ